MHFIVNVQMSNFARCLLLWCALGSQALPVWAAYPLADESNVATDDFAYAVQLGGGAGYKKGLISAQDRLLNGEPLVYLTLDLQYKNFFLASANPRFGAHISAGTLGYRLWQNEHNDLSLIGYSPHNSIDANAESLFDTGPIQALEGLNTRNADMMWGIRYQYWTDVHFFAGEVAQDSDAHYSQHLRFIYSYRHQIKNWDLYYNTSLMLTPAKLVNYYYGVRPHEVRANRAAYQAGGGAQFTLSVTAVYPLSEQWLFESSLSNSFYTKAYRQSPLVDHPTDLQLLLSLRYVF